MLARGLPTLPAITLLTSYVPSKLWRGKGQSSSAPSARPHPVCASVTGDHHPTDGHSRQAAALKGGINF